MDPPDRLSVIYVDDEPGLLEVTKAFLEIDGTISVHTEADAFRLEERLSSGPE